MSNLTQAELTQLAAAAVRLYNAYGDPDGALTGTQQGIVEKAAQSRDTSRKAYMGNAAVREACSSKPGGFDQFAFDQLMGGTA